MRPGRGLSGMDRRAFTQNRFCHAEADFEWCRQWSAHDCQCCECRVKLFNGTSNYSFAWSYFVVIKVAWNVMWSGVSWLSKLLWFWTFERIVLQVYSRWDVPLIDWLIDCLIDWLMDWLIDWLIDWSIDWLDGLHSGVWHRRVKIKPFSRWKCPNTQCVFSWKKVSFPLK